MIESAARPSTSVERATTSASRLSSWVRPVLTSAEETALRLAAYAVETVLSEPPEASAPVPLAVFLLPPATTA